MTIELDPEYTKAAAALKDAGAEPADPLTTLLAEARAQQERYFAFLAQDLPDVDAVSDFEVPGPVGPFATRIYYPTARRETPVIVFVRGGGWWTGSLDSHARTMRLLAKESGYAVCGVDYHRAPERHYPCQLEEVLAAIRWLRDGGASLGIDGARIVMCGESAGANLSALTAVRLRSEAPKTLSGLVLFYGNYAAPKSKARPYSKWVWSQYLGTKGRRINHDAVPLDVDVDGLPPFWLGVGEADPLREDTLRFCEKLRIAGVKCQMKRYPGLPHGFVMFNRLLAPAAQAVRDAAEVAQSFTSQGASLTHL